MTYFTIEPTTVASDPDYPGPGPRRDTLHDLRATAARKGLVVRTPNANELYLDIDSEPAESECKRLIARLNEPNILRAVWSPSPSGEPGHWHVVVTIDRPIRDAFERIMLQAILGSDPMRELLSLERIQTGSDSDAVSVFFERLP